MKLLMILFFTLELFSFESLFAPIPPKKLTLTPKEELGKKLFHDAILSKDGTVSCATCHVISNYGVDNLKTSIGVNGLKGDKNSPTVYNASYNLSQFWDGRAKDLQEQALAPIVNPLEMGETLESVIKKLKANKEYVAVFEKLYENGITAQSLSDSIAKYEKTLVTPNSRFDEYLRGDTTALNAKEIEGFKIFKKRGCVACHNGINIGGTMYQRIGLFDDFSLSSDLGRFNVTGKEYDKRSFKVPSLRNVAQTAPYFHNGSVTSLRDAVKIMITIQLGRDLSDDEIDKIVAFLKTLTGEVDE